MNPWIGVDLDATLARYEGWKGPDHIGDPIPAIVKRIKQKLEEGMTIKIFTARVCDSNPNKEHSRSLIKEYTKKHIGVELEVTSEKDFAMIELWDDRVKQVIPNSGVFMEDLVAMMVTALKDMNLSVEEFNSKTRAILDESTAKSDAINKILSKFEQN